MNRPILTHVALLGAALVSAYFVWTREPDTKSDSEVQILSMRDKLDRVVYEAEDRTVEIIRHKDQADPYFWVKVTTMEAPPPKPFRPPPAPAAPAGGHAHGVPGGAPAHGAAPAGAAKPALAPAPAPAKPTAVPPAAGAKPAAPAAMPKPAVPKPAVPKPAAPKAKPAGEKPSAGTPSTPPKVMPGVPAPAKPASVAAGAPAPHAAPAAPAAPPIAPKKEPPLAKVRKDKEFKGSKLVEELMKDLGELSAVRSLGTLSHEQLEKFELTDAKKKATLTLVMGSTPRVFIVGGNTYGNMDYYIQDRQSQRVYVIKPKTLQDMRYAEFRLIERELHGFAKSELDRVEISAKEGKKTLEQKNRRDPSGAFWEDSQKPGKQKELYRNWMGKLEILRVTDYVPRNKKPAGLTEVLGVKYFLGSKTQGFLKLYKGIEIAPEEATPPAAPSKEAYYVETEYTAGLAALNSRLAEELVRDIKSIVASQ